MIHRILFAWELGGNYGHLTRTLPVAERLRQLNHQVLYTVRDIEIAHELLAQRNIPFVPVPLPTKLIRLQHPPGNYPELLLAEGFAEITTLAGLIQAWLHLFSLFKPDAIVIDHAPTAIIAARIARIPVVAIGCSFTLPPYPFPPISTFDDKRLAGLNHAETILTTTINQILKQHRAPPLESLAELFRDCDLLLATFPELDHFGPRNDATYLGPIGVDSSNVEVDWASNHPIKIFAYLRSQIRATLPMLHALRNIDAEVVTVVSGLSPAQTAPLGRPGMQVLSQTVAMQPILQQANVLISHGGALTTQALANGIPTLVLPHTPEQHLRGLRVELLGAGINARHDRSQPGLTAAIRRLAENPSYRSAAKLFAQQHADFNQDTSVQLAAGRIERAIATA